MGGRVSVVNGGGRGWDEGLGRNMDVGTSLTDEPPPPSSIMDGGGGG